MEKENKLLVRNFVYGSIFGIIGMILMILLFLMLVRDEDGDKRDPPKFQDIHSLDFDSQEAGYLITLATYKGGSVGDRAYNILVALNRVWSEDYPDNIEDVCELELPCGMIPEYPESEWELSKEAMGLIVYERFDNSKGSCDYRRQAGLWKN